MKKFILSYLLLFSGVFANSQAPFLLNEKLSIQDLSSNISIHEDFSRSLDFKDILSKNFSELQSKNMGYSSSVFWLKIPIRNESISGIDFYLEYGSTIIDRIELYEDSSSEPIKVLGDRVAFSERSINYRNPIFKIKMNPGETKNFYLRLESESTIPIQVTAYSVDSFLNHATLEQVIYGFYFGWMLVMIFYNLFLFASARIKSYLFYVFFIFSFAMFQFILNGFAFQYIWGDYPNWANQSLLVFMLLATITGLLFATHFLKARTTMNWLYRIYQILWSLGGILLILSFFIGYSASIRLATVFAALAAVLLIVNTILALQRGIRAAKIFAVATLVFIIGVFLYTLKSLGFLPSNALTNWTIQIGSALQVALLSLGLADRINELSLDLKTRVNELGEANAKLHTSDNRFRQLFHGVSDIIFVLDEDWNFIDVNRSVTKQLGFKPEEIKGKNILELVFKSKDLKDTYNRIFVMEKLEELHETEKAVDFLAEFQQKFVMEPKELLIKLQYVFLENKKEILGTASVMVEDILGRYLKKERIEFSIDNYLRNAEIMSNKLTNHIKKFSDINTLMAVRTSLREIIINAIEHGNLNINFDEKTKAMEDGNYLQFIQNRQNDPRYKDKKIVIEYVLDSKKVAYRITDEGKGFDHKKMMEAKMENLNQEFAQHGRGIMMTKDVFDIIEYNDKGNQVSLVKYFR
jgi:two-component system, sensor histidine kinase LadS